MELNAFSTPPYKPSSALSSPSVKRLKLSKMTATGLVSCGAAVEPAAECLASLISGASSFQL